jgi:hypothetical protein
MNIKIILRENLKNLKEGSGSNLRAKSSPHPYGYLAHFFAKK